MKSSLLATIGLNIACIVLLAIPLSSQAAPNGYTLIPIAKVFGNGVASFSYAQAQLGTFSAYYTTQYGLINRFEVGLDWQSAPKNEQAYVGNCKYLLFHSPGHLPDIACGLENIGNHQETVPYVVATTQPGMFGVSLGATQPPGAGGGESGVGFLHTSGIAPMGGVAYNLNPVVQVVADFIGGSGGYHSFGVIAAASSTIAVNVAVTDPNSRGSGPQGFVLNVAYTFHAVYRRHHDAQGANSGSAPASTKPAAPVP